eukprot:758235-Hanusia_phi.AAC.1
MKRDSIRHIADARDYYRTLTGLLAPEALLVEWQVRSCRMWGGLARGGGGGNGGGAGGGRGGQEAGCRRARAARGAALKTEQVADALGVAAFRDEEGTFYAPQGTR